MQTRYAGFWIRLLADLIDTAILSLGSWLIELMVLGAIFWVKVLKQGSGVPPSAFSETYNSLLGQIVDTVAYILLALPYYIYGHYRYGTTLGKRPFKIFVVNAEGETPITLRQSVYRCLGYVLSYLILCTGYLMAAFQPQKRALHDLVAGTVSIRREKAPQS